MYDTMSTNNVDFVLTSAIFFTYLLPVCCNKKSKQSRNQTNFKLGTFKHKIFIIYHV